MVWLFGQVWVLCVLAFAAGSAVTWLVFVRPLRGAAADADGDWTPVPTWAPAPVGPGPGPVTPDPTIVPPPGPAADPALAALEGQRPGRDHVGPGVTATGALDLLGVDGHGAGQLGIPSQAPPVDSPDPDGRADHGNS